MMIKRFHLSIAVVLLFALISTIIGQTPSAKQEANGPYDDEVVRITTNLVQVDAVVTDKNGRYVTDLRPEDFEVTEDGKKQELTNFSYINVMSGSPSQPATNTTASTEQRSANLIPPARLLKPEQLRRTIALVVDDLSLSAESTYYVRRTLKNYLDEQIQENDLSAIVRTSSGIGVLQQFTSDKRILYAAVDRIRWFPRSRGGLSAVQPKNSLSEDSGGSEGVDASKAGTSEENRQENSVRDTIGALMYIVRGFQNLPGRKAIVLFTDSLRLFNRVGPGVDTNTERMQRLIDLANRSSVVFYSIDARGLQPLNFTAAEPAAGLPNQTAAAMTGVGSPRQNFFEDQDGMNYLAKETGGIFIKDNNDLNKGLERVLEDQKGYYLIGYRPDASTFDAKTGQRRFHNLKVQIKRPGLSVRSRTGFFGVAEPKVNEQPRTPQQQLMAALASPFGASGVDIRMTSLFNNDAARGSYMRSLVYVNASDLKFSEEAQGWRSAQIDIAAVIFNGEGRAIDQVSETREIRVTAEGYRSVTQFGLTYALNVPVKVPGTYQLRIAVRDAASQKTGSANQVISVPDINKGYLAISGIVIAGNTASSAQANQGTNNSPGAESDPRFGPAVRRLKQGMLLDYGYMVYNAQTDKSTGKPQLTTQLRLFRDGKLIFTSKVTPVDTSKQADLKRLIAGGSLQVGAELTPGDYVLQITVTDLLAKSKQRVVTGWTDFEIVK
ncbi:MAG TPA: VWA domain-containing protein [Pyrinomonadaceae bacterium]|jgi:VWFA-related protein